MIVRDASEPTLLISQVDHAQLAGDLAAAWGNDRVPGLPLAELLVPAVRDHDLGWREWETAPTTTADGRPRGFLEMPAGEAAEIWTRSIDACAAGFPSSAEALRRLRADGGEVTPDDAAALEHLLRHRGSFGVERFGNEATAGGGLTEESVAASLARFERKGLIRRLPDGLGGSAFAIDLPSVGGSPLGGLWVSGHFRALAESAKEHRDDPAEVAAIDAFLAEQDGKRADWRSAAAGFAGEELERVIDTGTRYVRFFDRISLWLCMAERDEPWEATLSSALTLRFTPRPSSGTVREIGVDPWPFREEALELSVVASAAGDEEHTTLRWTLT